MVCNGYCTSDSIRKELGATRIWARVYLLGYHTCTACDWALDGAIYRKCPCCNKTMRWRPHKTHNTKQ